MNASDLTPLEPACEWTRDQLADSYVFQLSDAHLEELDAALAELPPGQREVFVAHEIEGRSFKEIAARTGVGVNTLLSRKRYAVLHLRRRLQAIYDEFIDTGGDT